MDRITPLDLESARFPIVRKGYDTNAVDAMLKTAALELASAVREVQDLKARFERDTKELELFRQKESTLADALILAQRTADETRAMAHKEAELIVEHGKRQVEDTRRAAQDELREIERKLEQRRQDRRNFEIRFRTLLNDYLATLATEEQDAAAG